MHRPCRKFHAGKPFALPSAGGAHGGSRLRTQPSPRDFPRRSRAAELGAGDRGIPPEHPKRAAAPLHAPATSSAAQAEISQLLPLRGCKKGTAWPTEPAHGPRGYVALVQSLPQLAKLVQRYRYLTLTHAANYPTKNGQKWAEFAKCSPLEGLQDEHPTAAERWRHKEGPNCNLSLGLPPESPSPPPGERCLVDL